MISEVLGRDRWRKKAVVQCKDFTLSEGNGGTVLTKGNAGALAVHVRYTTKGKPSTESICLDIRVSGMLSEFADTGLEYYDILSSLGWLHT